MQRQAARIAELTAERDQLEQESRLLRRGQDELIEGRDYTWQDRSEDIARVLVVAHPHKAKQVAAHILQMSQATVPQQRTKRVRVRRDN